MNFKFYRNYGNKEFNEKISGIESNINLKKYPFALEIRKALEIFLDYEYTELEEIRNAGSKIKHLEDNNLLKKSIINKLYSLNDLVKPSAHAGYDFTKVKFEEKKEMLRKMFDIISNYKEVYDIQFNENNYIDSNKIYFEKKCSKQYFEEMLDEKEVRDFECFELFSSKFLIDLDEIDFEQRVIGGKNDGGIDIFWIDEEIDSIKIANCKYTNSISKEDIQDCLDKICNTISSFYENEYHDKNEDIKNIGANWLNYIEDNKVIEVYFITSAEIKFNYDDILNNIIKKINTIVLSEVKVNVKIVDALKVEEILELNTNKAGVQKGNLELVDRNAMIEIPTENFGNVVMAVITGESLRAVYYSQTKKGEIFEKNVRGYIKNSKIDSGINKTLKNNPEKFLILNNGLTIIAKNIKKDGKLLKFDELFIVNGGQTTSLIGEIEDTLKEVKVFVKIIDSSNENIVDEISEASNNQKPIKPIDLIANNKYIKKFSELINSKKSKYALIFKRSDRLKKDAKLANRTAVQTEELMKMYYSFIEQKPGTARSGFKNQITKDVTDNIFRKFNISSGGGYNFFVDIMYLNEIYDLNLKEWKNLASNQELKSKKDEKELEYLKNGKQATIAIIGAIIYFLTLKDSKIELTIDNFQNLRSKMILNSFIKTDEFEDKSLKDQNFKELINLVAEVGANKIKETGKVATNFLKTDGEYSKIFDEIISNFGARTQTQIEVFARKLLREMNFKK